MHLMLGQRATFNRQVTLIQIQGGFRFKYVSLYVCMCVSLSVCMCLYHITRSIINTFAHWFENCKTTELELTRDPSPRIQEPRLVSASGIRKEIYLRRIKRHDTTNLHNIVSNCIITRTSTTIQLNKPTDICMYVCLYACYVFNMYAKFIFYYISLFVVCVTAQFARVVCVNSYFVLR